MVSFDFDIPLTILRTSPNSRCTSGRFIRFTDGVSLSIKLQVGLKAEAELYQIYGGDVQVLQRYSVV
jgi:hypothetical protein